VLLLLLACNTVKDLPAPPGASETATSASDETSEPGDTTGPGSDTTGGDTDTSGGATGTSDDTSDDTTGSGTEPTDEDEPYLYEEDDDGDEQLNLDVLERGLGDALDVIFSIDPMSFHETYEALANSGDGYCPYYYEEYITAYDQFYWRDSCTADGGVEFSGYGISYAYADYVDGDADYSINAYFSGAARLIDDEGRRMDASGYSRYYEYDYVPDGRTYFYSRIWGEFSWEGDGGRTWLSSGLTMDIYTYGARYITYDPVGYYTLLDGSLAGLDGAVTAINLTDVFLYSESMDSACPDEPSGTISLRDADGDWYDVEFQGPRYWGGEAFPGECDGCGDVFFRGEPLGAICPDFSHLKDWGDRPW